MFIYKTNVAIRNVTEGKALATSYECKFIETSVGINHNVDELLVGLLTQIRLKQQHAVARAERQRYGIFSFHHPTILSTHQ